jgi:hypothetical protein
MAKINRILGIACPVLLIGICPAAFAGDSGFSVSSGAEHSRGDYGSGSNVEEIYVPLRLNYTSNSIGYGPTLPYLSVRPRQVA